MNFNLDILSTALAEILGEDHSPERIAILRQNVEQRAGCGLCDVDALNWRDAGRGIVAALIGGASNHANSLAHGMTLHIVALDVPGGSTVVLSPDEALAHPMLKGWLGKDAGETIGLFLQAGSNFAIWSLDAPTIDYIELAAINGINAAAAEMHIPVKGGSMRVLFQFGSGPDMVLFAAAQPMFSWVQRLSGDALAKLGFRIRAMAREAAIAPPPPPEAPTAAPSPIFH